MGTRVRSPATSPENGPSRSLTALSSLEQAPAPSMFSASRAAGAPVVRFTANFDPVAQVDRATAS